MRTMMIHVPEMRNEACIQIVVAAISKCSGVDPTSIRVDTKRRIVTVSYDSLVLSLKNIEFAVAEAGFQANDVPAKPEAQKALPPECQPRGIENSRLAEPESLHGVQT